MRIVFGHVTHSFILCRTNTILSYRFMVFFCADNTMMLETDIILRGIGTENQTDIPVHAHPPATDSDVTLVEWLDRATQEPDVGMKLDIKYIEALEPSMKIISEKAHQLHAPLWMNADIVAGPNSPKDPVSPREFIDTCNRHFPLTTMSLGFTTAWNDDGSSTENMYTWQMIFDILQYTFPLQQPVTFPMRAMWCVRSWSKFTWLLGLKEDFSITIWSGSSDEVDVTGLLNLRFHGDTKRIYYDLPDPLMMDFKEALEDGVVMPTAEVPPRWNSNLWDVVGPSGSAGDFVFLSTESAGIMGGRTAYAGWVQSRDQHRPTETMTIRGIVQFVNRYDSDSEENTRVEVAFRTRAFELDGGICSSQGNGNYACIVAYVANDGSIGIRDIASGYAISLQALPSAECYRFEITDDATKSACDLQVQIIRCSDAVTSPPDEGKMAALNNVSVSQTDQYDSFYVTFGKMGYSKDIIVEEFHVSSAQQTRSLVTSFVYFVVIFIVKCF